MASEVDETTRRDFLMLAAGGFAAVGGAAVLWPFIDQMNPDASTLSLASTEVDLSKMEEGQAITVMWRGKPIFIRYRTSKEVQEAESVKLDELPDSDARSELSSDDALDALDANRTVKGKEQWLVLVGICTHLGCVPKGNKPGDNKGEYGGWFCPCHGSHYDISGRIRKGPAPHNMAIPPYEFITDDKIKIG
ncbi:MAG: ubiquinol-cytochrome c reductase iron-sulfur subunit [Pseudomonadota bacterium]